MISSIRRCTVSHRCCKSSHVPQTIRGSKIKVRFQPSETAGTDSKLKGALQQQKTRERNILVAVGEAQEGDDSCALEWAIKNMLRKGDELHLVHCVPSLAFQDQFFSIPSGRILKLPSLIGSPEAWESSMKTSWETRMEEMYGRKLTEAEVPYHLHVVQETAMTGKEGVGAALCEQAEKLDAAAVVLSSNSRGGLGELLLGSVANYLIHKCSKPVAVLHANNNVIKAAAGKLPGMASEAAEQVRDSAERAGQATSDAVKKVTSPLTDAAGRAGQATSEVAQDVASALSSAAERSGNATRGAAKDATTAVSDAAKDATTAVSDAAKDATTAVSDAAKDATTAVSDAAKKAGSTTSDAVKDVTTPVSDAAGRAGKATKEAVQEVTSPITDAAEQADKATKEAAQDASSKMSDAAERTGKAAKEAAQEATSNLSSATQKAGRDTKEKVQDAASDASAAAGHTGQAVKETAQDATSDLSDATKKAGKETKDAASDASAAAGRTGQAVKETAQDATSDLSDATKKAGKETKDAASDASAAAGRTGQALKETAQDVTSDLSDATKKAGKETKDAASDASAAAGRTGQALKETAQDATSDLSDATKKAGKETKEKVQDSAADLSRRADTSTKQMGGAFAEGVETIKKMGSNAAAEAAAAVSRAKDLLSTALAPELNAAPNPVSAAAAIASGSTVPTTRNILIPVDASDESLATCQWTLDNLYQKGDNISLVHIIPCLTLRDFIPYPPFDTTLPAAHLEQPEGVADKEEAEWRQTQMTRFTKALDTWEGGVEYTYDVIAQHTQDPVFSIGEDLCAKAKHLNAAALVMSTHQRSALSELLLGSVTTYVSHHSDQPVVVLHNVGRSFKADKNQAGSSSNAG
ncbi:hypothetical protein CEUSTIGMA_g6562.t1 [Chlamydomonas eustigma]|uniref:UspA domain-containing protein n=1 Tax=Chlamydomonas eustigma TaxID=1157962 RepID=A0A250X8A5_9CHLO|nr:hypothetical protein CEUSTIGMA_g6562.t1 [Chlamydomonas eustigma]|eukprot:GAX79122.1 hypothetical protein CEUSTIGMA_g6562.t1 [Chlamydomonas eustigma]